jgi:hypothetical protein
MYIALPAYIQPRWLCLVTQVLPSGALNVEKFASVHLTNLYFFTILGERSFTLKQIV